MCPCGSRINDATFRGLVPLGHPMILPEEHSPAAAISAWFLDPEPGSVIDK